jgi:phosphonate dehydrogenase
LRPRIVVTQRIHPEVVALLSKHADVVMNESPDRTWSREELLDRARDADALMVFMPDSLDDDFLAACPRLKIVAAALKGFDNFDVAACSGTFAGWRPTLYGTSLVGATVGIVGFGQVGSTLERLLQGFSCRVLHHDSATPGTPLDELLAASDFVLPLLPLTPATLHLFNAATIAKMKPGAFLINVSRGSVVDENAVADALAGDHLAGYAADTFEMEDWARTDRPASIAPRLLAMRDKTLFTPHLGSAVQRVRQEIEMTAARNILQALGGQRPEGALTSWI